MDLKQFAALVKTERNNILSRWRQQVRKIPAARHLDTPTLNDHIPDLLEELATAFDIGSLQSIPEALAEDSAIVHGFQRLQDGFDIEEVVAEYNILRGCIHDLAQETHFNLQGQPFHIINRVFDQAIGLALQTYANQRASEVQQRREEYLAFVAHDLYTPLFAISLAGRNLERCLPRNGYTDDSAQMLKTLRRGVHQLEDLVNKVMEENTNQDLEPGLKLVRREFDLWPLAEALVEDLQPVAEPSGTRMVNQVPYDLRVYADAGLLRRIFQNLVSNALKYTSHGEVVVGARELTAEGVVECWVSDNGAGIPADLIAKVFDKGESDPATTDGTGLGLAIVKTFTEAHGGQATVESKEGEGATFRLTLPGKEHA